MTRKLFRQIVNGLIIVLVIFAGFYFLAQPYAFQGSLIEPPLPTADFSLKQADGKIFRLSEQQGQFVLLYFGYTFCPDVCPTTLYDLARAKERLGKDASEIQVLMVTVDPERDDPDHLEKYVTTFDPSFIGLTGDITELETIWSDFGVYRKKNETNGASGYLVDHASRVYVIDRNGDLRMTFPFGMEFEAMADDLAHLLDSE